MTVFGDAFCVLFRAPPIVPELSASFSRLSSAHNCECSRAPVGLPIQDCGAVDIHAFVDSSDNNNNNTIWGGSVLTVEEPPPHSGELKHALPQAGGPTQSQLSPPCVVRTPHLHGAPTTEETVKL